MEYCIAIEVAGHDPIQHGKCIKRRTEGINFDRAKYSIQMGELLILQRHILLWNMQMEKCAIIAINGGNIVCIY